GFYADALRHARVVLPNLALFDREGFFYPRSALVHKLLVIYVTLGRPEEALQILETEGLAKLTEPASRARALYQAAMLHARHLPVRDNAAAERYLEQAMAELEHAVMEPDDRAFLTGFLLNG